MSDHTVKQVDGAFIIEGPDGKRLAETTYQLAGAVMTMPHTWVDDSLRGQGAGRKLVDAAVAYARAHAYKIHPTCPYVKSVFDKDPSIHDVRAA